MIFLCQSSTAAHSRRSLSNCAPFWPSTMKIATIWYKNVGGDCAAGAMGQCKVHDDNHLPKTENTSALAQDRTITGFTCICHTELCQAPTHSLMSMFRLLDTTCGLNTRLSWE